MSENISSLGLGKEEKLKYDSISVDYDKMNSTSFLNLEKKLIAAYEKKGYTLREKNPEAELRFRDANPNKPILTMIYLFVKPNYV